MTFAVYNPSGASASAPFCHESQLPIIQSSAADGTGYLAVTVPPSGVAPHMVDGRYYGRADKTKYVLNDEQVRALHLRQRATADRFREELFAAMGAAPAKGIIGAYVGIASPVGTDRSLLKARNTAPNWMGEATSSVLASANGQDPGYAPNLSFATYTELRPRAVALTNNMQPGRNLPVDTSPHSLNRMVEVVFGDDGTIKVFTGRATDTLSGYENRKMIFEKLVVGNTRHLVALAVRAARDTRFTGSWQLAAGSWQFGVGVQGLQGGVSWDLRQSWSSRTHPYTEDSYTEITTATGEELERTPDVVVGRLTLPLLRALGSDWLAQYNDLQDNPSPAS